MSKPSPQDKIIRVVAGIFVIISVALGHYHSPYWLLFTVFVGLNLIQSAFTGFCPLCKILAAFGIKSCE